MDMKVQQQDEAIASMRTEAMRLIEMQQELLSEIKEKIPAATLDQGDERASKSAGQFTPKAIDLKIAALEDNRCKVDKLDMVLAVVGTMKAGKSTCINAIVGREILPNRNRPMTALPTIIRHTPGVSTPVLHFSKQQQEPIKKLLVALHQKLKNLDIEAAPKIASDQDLLALANAIRGELTLQTRYEGEEGIFNFLKILNDLVRISAELKVVFPFDSYTSVTDFPSIEVEFFHLKQTDSSNQLGRFALLDTPGFNEAGQSQHLMPMLQEQLSKATAVLAVLDYTQLKSVSEKELRDELFAIAEYSGDRMFALVNKFDERNANSDGEAATRKYVANHLLNEVFGNRTNVDKRIFPVAGQLAYLVKRAELTLETHDNLGWVEGQPESWIDTFGEKAFGTRYRKYINNRKEVLDACGELWEASLFNAPLTHAIKYSYNNAAQMAIQAATDKLSEIALGSKGSDVADGIGTMLDMRLQGLQTTSEELEKLVTELSAGIMKIKSKEGKATVELDALLAGTQHRIKQSLKEASSKVIHTVKYSIQGTGSFEDSEESPIDSKHSFLSAFVFAIALKPTSGEQLFTGKDKKLKRDNVDAKDLKLEVQDVMTFGSDGEAKSKLMEIASVIKKFLEEEAAAISEKVQNTAREFHTELEKFQTEISNAVAEFKEHAQKAGFGEIKLKVPKIKPLNPMTASDSELQGLIKDKSYNVTRQREQSGGLSWFKRKVDFFDAGWGKDDYETRVSKFEFSKDDLVACYGDFVKSYTAELETTIQSNFSEPLEAGKLEFFKLMNAAFESIRENMESSRLDQLRSKDQQQQTKANIEELKQRYEDGIEEIKELIRNSKKLSFAREAA